MVRPSAKDHAWRTVYETVEGLRQQPGCSGALVRPPCIEIALEV